TLRFDLPAHVRTQLGGPGPDSTHYFRNAATAIFTSHSHTVVATIIAIADGTTGRCSANGAVEKPADEPEPHMTASGSVVDEDDGDDKDATRP
ncbi:MAG TPA: hypothetical protein VM785_08750, partial [Gaiellales bacterium]|nr:hypothetical protein [Gaiellales bacterium]